MLFITKNVFWVGEQGVQLQPLCTRAFPVRTSPFCPPVVMRHPLFFIIIRPPIKALATSPTEMELLDSRKMLKVVVNIL